MSAVVRRLFRSDQVAVSEFICDQPRSRAGATERTDAHELVFVRRGVFVLRSGGRETVTTPNQAIIFPAGCDFTTGFGFSRFSGFSREPSFARGS